MQNDDGTRIECSTCGRKFNPSAIDKHEKICQKVTNKKRKAFDPKEQRKAEGAAEIDSQNAYSKPFGRQQKKPATQAASKPAGKLPKWKQQSLQFRQAMNVGKPDQGGGAGGFNPSQEMSGAQETYDDRTECQWCNRKFNEEAAKRHIPLCETKHKANLMKMGGKAGASKRGTQIGFRGKKY